MCEHTCDMCIVCERERIKDVNITRLCFWQLYKFLYYCIVTLITRVVSAEDSRQTEPWPHSCDEQNVSRGSDRRNVCRAARWSAHVSP